MNRTQAAKHIDELTDRRIAIIREGRCPGCEALPRLAAGEIVLEHADDCRLVNSEQEILRLCQRFGIKLKQVQVSVEIAGEPAVLLSAIRAGRRALAVGGPHGVVEGVYTDDETCDFCNLPEAAWQYPCRDFDASRLKESIGPWNACAPCRDLIEAGALDELASKAAVAFIARHPVDEARVRERSGVDLTEFLTADFLTIYRRFDEHRTGPAERLVSEEASQ